MPNEKPYTYRCIEPGYGPPFKKRIRRTRGIFVGWTSPIGLLHVPYAIFRNRASDLLIPMYDLTPETKARIGKPQGNNPPELFPVNT